MGSVAFDYLLQRSAAEGEFVFETDRLKVASIYEDREQHHRKSVKWTGLETANKCERL